MLGKLIAVAALAAGGVVLKKRMGQNAQTGSRPSVEETVDVQVPVSTAYNQFTQFEEFPKFMSGVEEVRQLDDTHLHWRARIAGKEEHWHSEITSQIPDKRIAWRSTSGPRNSGVVSFQSLSPESTRVTLRMEYEPSTLVEKIGSAFGAVKFELGGNLQRFADFLETRHRETGAWRGTVQGGSTVTPSAGESSGSTSSTTTSL